MDSGRKNFSLPGGTAGKGQKKAEWGTVLTFKAKAESKILYQKTSKGKDWSH